MAKDLSSAVSAQLAAQEKRPVNLFEIGLSGTTLYYAASNTNIVWQAKTYAAKAIRYGSIKQSAEGQIERITVRFDNTARDLSSYVATYDIRNKPLIIRRIYQGAASGTTDYVEVFRGFMEEPQNIGRVWMPISATMGKALGRKLLLRKFQRPCPHRFGDSFCNTDGVTDLTTSSYTSGAACYSGGTNYVLAATPGGVTSTTDYWNFGRIQVGNSGTTHNRIVEASIDYEGADLVSTGDFSADSDWTKDANWTIGAGVATCDGLQGGDSEIKQEGILTVGKTYEVVWTITARTAGSIAAWAGTQIANTTYQAAGGPNINIITCAGNGDLRFVGTNWLGSEFAGSIDNVSVKEVGTKLLWNVELPDGAVAASTWQYSVTKGCCKNWDCCSGTSAYGPTSGNTKCFGGFIHIGREREQGGW